MSTASTALEVATVRQQCKVLHLPSIAAQCSQLAEQAVRERRTHLGYLEALLQAELEDREQRLIERRIQEARLPRMKTLGEFDFAQCPKDLRAADPRTRPGRLHRQGRADHFYR
jgi:DNA replication protein DnaC